MTKKLENYFCPHCGSTPEIVTSLEIITHQPEMKLIERLLSQQHNRSVRLCIDKLKYRDPHRMMVWEENNSKLKEGWFAAINSLEELLSPESVTSLETVKCSCDNNPNTVCWFHSHQPPICCWFYNVNHKVCVDKRPRSYFDIFTP